jgi:hypothetical protein
MVRPPGLSAAWYTPEEEREIRGMILGQDYTEFLRTGKVSEALREAYRAARLAHELKAEFDGRFDFDAPDRGAGPVRDAVGAVQARDEAIARVDTAADPAWKMRALAALRRVAERQAELTAEDVWVEAREVPEEPRAMGPLMQSARAKGWIEPTDQHRQSSMVVNHARPMRVWRSLVRQ